MKRTFTTEENLQLPRTGAEHLEREPEGGPSCLIGGRLAWRRVLARMLLLKNRTSVHTKGGWNMGRSVCAVAVALCLALGLAFSAGAAEKPIVIGAPLATAFLYGWDAERGIKLAVDEINAAGGVNVAGKRRPFKVEVIDTRDLEPGVPVSDALLALEKLILEKKADFIIGGPVRSEAALAAMDLLSKYKKVSILTTGVLTPAYTKKVEDGLQQVQVLLQEHEPRGGNDG